MLNARKKSHRMVAFLGLAKARRRSGLLDRCAGSVHRSLGGIGSTCGSRSGTGSSRSSARSRISGRGGGRSGGWSRSRDGGRSGCRCFFFLATCNQSSGSNNSCQNERLVHFENYLMSLEGKLVSNAGAVNKRQPRKKRTMLSLPSQGLYKKARHSYGKTLGMYQPFTSRASTRGTPDCY